eukprot:TRINITY_DN1555_c0_g1_i1.p1 TRINITY_DN1555_c0_g1~~TRINITY_DN1555_c0_g1_i1.p1  ORF type:complete len:301 (+),score=44.85 TRINITY_DN1555_c0_g1_i1:56-958(+)
MGDTLSKPVTEKHSERFENEWLKVGASGMQGWRRGMEDAHTAALGKEHGMPEGHAFFAVYDGHCGPNIAQYCSENLHRRMLADQAWEKADLPEAIKSAFLTVDEDLLKDPQYRNDGSGCTAVVALLTPTQVLCGNAGDSRCVLCRGGKAIPLSQDHKPNNEAELKRIQKAGSFVSSGRVNGNLALSRAIGDFAFKQNKTVSATEQAITAHPEVTVMDTTPQDEFLVLACDGIWDVMSNDELVAYIRNRLTETQDLALICENVFDKCLAPAAPGIGCDNMTMVLVLFKQNWERHLKESKGE